MVIRQIIMVLNTIMENPGLNYGELGTKIEERYGEKNTAVVFMFLEDTDKNSHLRGLLEVIYCVEEKDGRYYYNSTLPIRDRRELEQVYIEGFIIEKEMRKKKM